MSTDLFRQISQVAQQLKQEGKAVNLALVRARMPSTDPAKLFTAFQQWRNQPQVEAKEVPAESLSPSLSQASVAAQLDLHKIHQDIQRLEQKVDRILSLLERQD